MSSEAEVSPTGFWTLNYAAFVVHRRDDWAVSVKGFNKYVWDFESSWNQNVFGLYQSHGALLVANSEAALQTHDIHNGWDWTRHPGTTTIKMDLAQLVSENYRYEFLKLKGLLRRGISFLQLAMECRRAHCKTSLRIHFRDLKQR